MLPRSAPNKGTLWVRDSVYASLMTYRKGYDNDHYLACILSSHIINSGEMPKRLGLSEISFFNLVNLHFSGAAWILDGSGYADVLDNTRLVERQELEELMWSHRSLQNDSIKWMARIVATGCMGSNHLWQDLGLWCRKDLSSLMLINFQSLAKKNDRDMKWKKFLYKQLCIQEGIYTCRAPSCEICKDYDACFGKEE